MADIKQAAKWMDEGKRVRSPHLSREISIGRPSIKDDCFLDQVIVVFVNGIQRTAQDCAPITTDDLLADDWEIADK